MNELDSHDSFFGERLFNLRFSECRGRSELSGEKRQAETNVRKISALSVLFLLQTLQFLVVLQKQY